MRRGAGWLVAVSLACLASAWGQPHIGYLYPAGGQKGTTVRIATGGQGLGGAYGVYVSGEGVRGTVVEYVRPLDNQERNDVGRFLNDFVRRRWSDQAIGNSMTMEAGEPPLPSHPWLRDLDARSGSELFRLRERLFSPKLQPNAQIAEQVELEITVDRDAAPGAREFRLMSPAGLSNPMRFEVGVLPEVMEEDVAGPGAADTIPLDLPVVVNGQVMPGEVDRFRLRARKGQQLVIRTQARELLPYLADAVPGWFQATTALYDASGSEVAYGDDYRFAPDPVLLCKIPEDGLYELEVRDAIYRGRDDFVYRISAGELPFVTQVFPLGGQEGTPTTASISGWNLPTDTLALGTEPGGASIRRAVLGGEQGLCNEVPYVVGSLPEATETEPNDAAAGAQEVTLPVVVNGRIGQPGDVDVFGFSGRAGEEVVAEVYARRLNSPLDSALRLMDSTGAVLALNDDSDDPEAGLVTHLADSYVRVTLPQDGEYRLQVLDTQQRGGEAYGYRLRLRPAQPGFALRVTPCSINMAAGGSARVTVHAVRKDGFDGTIEVGLKNAPAGFTVGATRIPMGDESVEVTVKAPAGVSQMVAPVELEGYAQIGGVRVTGTAAPAEDMMQAFLYRHLVPQEELLVAITGHQPVPAVWRPLVPGIEVATATPVRIPLGGTAQVRLKAPETLADKRQTPLEDVRFQLANAPRGMMLQDAAMAPTGVVLTLKTDANTASVGDVSNAIVEASTEVYTGAMGAEAGKGRQRVSLGVLPAIAYVIVRP